MTNHTKKMDDPVIQSMMRDAGITSRKASRTVEMVMKQGHGWDAKRVGGVQQKAHELLKGEPCMVNSNRNVYNQK